MLADFVMNVLNRIGFELHLSVATPCFFNQAVYLPFRGLQSSVGTAVGTTGLKLNHIKSHSRASKPSA